MKYLSLFSGVESATVAWEPLNWEPAAFSEVDPFCNALLAHRIPDVENLGDVTAIDANRLRELADFDLVVFGSPCQDLSVAGKRAGLNGDRSGLFRTAVRIIRDARDHCGCRFSLWENVPGVFNANEGRDFSEVLHSFTGCRHAVPEGGWQNAGAAYGPEALVEWRTLDAQFFGVPQRRRRVFVVADFGDWSGRSPVLFEPPSLSGHSQSSRAKREDVAGTLESRSTAGGFPSTDGACANHVIPYDLQAFGKYGTGKKASALKRRDWKDCTDLVLAFNAKDDTISKLDCSMTLQAQDNGASSAVVIPIHDQATRYAGKRSDRNDGKGNGLGIGQPNSPMNTLTSGDQHAVCFQANQRDEVRLMNGHGHTVGSVLAQPGMKGTNFVGLFKAGQSASAGGIGYSEQSAPTLTHSRSGSMQSPGMVSDQVIRRLTPMECERLQGLPDNWTQIPWHGKPAEQCPATPRYQCIGNSMAVPVMHWIGQRLDWETLHER